MVNKEKFERISLSFHQSFVPERRYLSALMKYAGEAQEANLEQISDSTGIPTGGSSGKVEPTLNYGKGMGLLEVSRGEIGRWRLALSPLGRMVLSEDQFMSEGFTQWVLHLLLCRRRGGAEAWYAIFAESSLALGRSFNEDFLKAYLTNRYGKRSNILGPLVKMYTSEASFSRCGALTEEGGRIDRRPAPCEKTHFPGYYYIFFLLWDDFFHGVQQVDVEHLERQTRFFATTGWSLPQINRFVDQLSDEGLAKIDRHTGHALILRACSTDFVLKNLYTNLL
jgi:hypothetical protein